MIIGSLCSGYGGLEQAVTRVLAGRPAWHSETDAAASRVLAREYPGVPNLGDLIRLADSPHRADAVDLLAMGVPCQPASGAGKRLAEADPRWLWPYARRLLQALRPPALVFENVEGLVTLRKGEVWRGILADMRADGYAVRWLVMGACVVGACHHRHRVFALGAYVGAGAPPAVRLDVPKCGARRGADLLLTPRAADAHQGATTPRGDGGAAGRVGPVRHSLDSIGHLLPTPLARDASGRGEGGPEYWAARDKGPDSMPLGAVISAGLLPTPTASDHAGAGHAAQGGENLRTAVIGERFGRYAAAVERWARVCGVAPPEPTEVGPRGGLRLAPAFPEWMMGLPAGHVTGVPDIGRQGQLRMIGNGVMPQQGAAALELLLGGA